MLASHEADLGLISSTPYDPSLPKRDPEYRARSKTRALPGVALKLNKYIHTHNIININT